MEKINVLFLATLLIVGTSGFVVADDDFDELEIPEAKKIGFFENMFDNVRFAFIVNKEKKIERALKLAEKRLAEAEALAEEDPERVEEARKKYDAFVARAEEILEKIGEAEAKNEDGSIKDIEKIARIQNKFERHRIHAETIYDRAVERFMENNASDEKLERFENFYNRALNRSDEMEKRILQNRENIIKRHKVLAEKSDEEIESLLVNIEGEVGLTEARERRAERAEVLTQKLIDVGYKKIDRAKERLNEANLTDEQRKRINSRIETAEQKIQKFEVRAYDRIGGTGISENVGEDNSVVASSLMSDYKIGAVTREDIKKALIHKYKSGTLTRSVLRAVVVKAYREGKLTREDMRWLIIHSYKLGELTRDDVRWLIINAYKHGELTRDDVHWLIIKSYQAGELTLEDVKELLKTAHRHGELTRADIVWLLQKAYQAGELTRTELTEAEIIDGTNVDTSSALTTS